MSEPFNPYHCWLGIPLARQPPDHYCLLGISRFEEDAEVIHDAVARQTNHIKRYEAGEHGRSARMILAEIAVAKACLLDRDAKSAYDATLSQPGSESKTNSVATSRRPMRSISAPDGEVPPPPPSEMQSPRVVVSEVDRRTRKGGANRVGPRRPMVPYQTHLVIVIGVFVITLVVGLVVLNWFAVP